MKNAPKIPFDATKRKKITREIRGAHLPPVQGGGRPISGMWLKRRSFDADPKSLASGNWDIDIPNYRYF